VEDDIIHMRALIALLSSLCILLLTAQVNGEQSLGEAVDCSSLVWTTGYPGWFWQDNVWIYGGSAAQSAPIGDGQSTYLETTVSGPAFVSFYWTVSSEQGCDFLSFYIDGILKDQISGELSSGIYNRGHYWQQKKFTIGEGTHTLRWVYSKDLSYSHGSDCGWVDYVYFNRAPRLMTSYVSPESGKPSTTFVYQVIYQDPEGDPAQYVKVVIDGDEHSMSYVSGSPGAGAIYQYTTTLSAGSHVYYFKASDGFSEVSTSQVTGPTVTKFETSLSISSSDLAPKTRQTITLVATLTSGGIPLPNRPIKWEPYSGFVYSSITYTDYSGQARCNYTTPSSAGLVLVKASFEGDSEYQGCEETISVHVRKRSTSLTISPSHFTVKTGDRIVLTATLFSEGEPVEGKQISWFSSRGSVDPSVTSTNYLGQAQVLYIAPRDSGSVSVKASFSGDSEYEESSDTIYGRVESPKIWLILALVAPSCTAGIWWIVWRRLRWKPKVPKPVPEAETRAYIPIYCPRCKAANLPGTRFCGKCGAPLVPKKGQKSPKM
jgi:ribosomal protein L40E